MRQQQQQRQPHDTAAAAAAALRRSLAGARRSAGNIGVSGEDVREPPSPCPEKVQISRPVYSQHRFQREFEPDGERRLRQGFMDTVFMPQRPKRSPAGHLLHWLPCLRALLEYRWRECLASDAVSGLSTAVMRVPQGMAYSVLALLPPMHGLYTAFVAALCYCVLGTSPHLVMASQGVVSLMAGQVAHRFVLRQPALSPGNGTAASSADAQLEATLIVTLTVGLVQLSCGVLRLGMLANYLSDPLVGGFTAGAAVEVVISQVPELLGCSAPQSGAGVAWLPQNLRRALSTAAGVGDFNAATLALSAGSATLLTLAKLANARLSRCCSLPLPGELLLLLLATGVCRCGRLQPLGVRVVGELPRGFSAARAPRLALLDAELLQDCCLLGLVAFTVAVSVAKRFALEDGAEVDANQEFVAHGAANVAGAFASCFVASGSMSCSALHHSLGGRSQAANLLAAGVVLLCILFLGSALADTPTCALSALLVVNLRSMLAQLLHLPQLWAVSKIDCLLWLVTFASVVVASVEVGLVVGMSLSLLTIVFRSQWPYACVLGRIPHTDIYKNVIVTPEAKEIDGVKIFRYEGSVYFASADHFRRSLHSLTGCNPRHLLLARRRREDRIRKLRHSVKEAFPHDVSDRAAVAASERLPLTAADLRPAACLHHVIVDLSCCSFIDSVGLRTLNQVLSDYTEAEVSVFLSNTRAAVRAMLGKSSVSKFDTRKIFLTNHDAVSAALQEAQRIEERNWLLFDCVAKQRMSVVKQHWVSRMPSEAASRRSSSSNASSSNIGASSSGGRVSRGAKRQRFA